MTSSGDVPHMVQSLIVKRDPSDPALGVEKNRGNLFSDWCWRGACTRVVEITLVQISFFRLCPSTSTQAKVSHHPKIVIPPVPACRGTGAQRSGGTCGLRWWKNRTRRRFAHAHWLVPKVKLQIPPLRSGSTAGRDRRDDKF
jgi:hypothetical protein